MKTCCPYIFQQQQERASPASTRSLDQPRMMGLRGSITALLLPLLFLTAEGQAQAPDSIAPNINGPDRIVTLRHTRGHDRRAPADHSRKTVDFVQSLFVKRPARGRRYSYPRPQSATIRTFQFRLAQARRSHLMPRRQIRPASMFLPRPTSAATWKATR